MKLVADRKVFRERLDLLASLIGGLVGDASGGDILLTVNKKGGCTIEAGGEGKYARVKIPKAAIGDASGVGKIVFSASIIRQLRSSGQVIELELDKKQRLKFKSGKMSGYVEALDDEVGDSILEEKPSKKQIPKLYEIPTAELLLCIGAVNFTPAIHQAEDDVFVEIKKNMVTAVMNDSVRGAVSKRRISTKAKFKFALPPSTLSHILYKFADYATVKMGISDDNILFLMSPSTDLFVMHPLSVNDESDEDVEELISGVKTQKRTVAFKANIGETLTACKHVVSVIPGGMAVDTKMEVQLGATSSRVTMRSSIGRMRHDFPIKRLSKSGTNKMDVFLSGKFFLEFLEMVGDSDEGYKVSVHGDVCIISALDLNIEAGEKIEYVMPLIEQ